MADRLLEFIRHKKDQASVPGVDWQAKKVAWIQSVEGLYDHVLQLLHASVISGDVSFERPEMQLTEEFAGTYSIPRLELNIANERVEFRPMGLSVFGADGRVDLRGARGGVTLLRSESGEWNIVLHRAPERKALPLESNSLRLALQRVMLPLS